MDKKTIKVKKIGENPGFCREYLKRVDSEQYFCKVEFKNVVEWFTCDSSQREPSCRIGDDVEFEIV